MIRFKGHYSTTLKMTPSKFKLHASVVCGNMVISISNMNQFHNIKAN